MVNCYVITIMLCIIDDVILNPFQTSNKRTILGWSNLSSCFNKAISRTVANGIPSSDAFLWFLTHAQTIYFYFGNTFIDRNISIGQHKKNWMLIGQKRSWTRSLFKATIWPSFSRSRALYFCSHLWFLHFSEKITTYPSKLGHHKWAKFL